MWCPQASSCSSVSWNCEFFLHYSQAGFALAVPRMSICRFGFLGQCHHRVWSSPQGKVLSEASGVLLLWALGAGRIKAQFAWCQGTGQYFNIIPISEFTQAPEKWGEISEQRLWYLYTQNTHHPLCSLPLSESKAHKTRRLFRCFEEAHLVNTFYLCCFSFKPVHAWSVGCNVCTESRKAQQLGLKSTCSVAPTLGAFLWP